MMPGMEDELLFPEGSIMQFYGDTPTKGWEWWEDAPKENQFGVPYEKPVWIVKL
jgi:hypothetical protein